MYATVCQVCMQLYAKYVCNCMPSMYATVNSGGNSKEQFKDSHRSGFSDDENEDIFKIALANS